MYIWCDSKNFLTLKINVIMIIEKLIVETDQGEKQEVLHNP